MSGTQSLLYFPTSFPPSDTIVPEVIIEFVATPMFDWTYGIIMTLSFYLMLKIPVSKLKTFKVIPCCLYVALLTNATFCHIMIILPLYDFTVSDALVNLQTFLNIMLCLLDLGKITSNYSFLMRFCCSYSISN
jgi:hypothetical protein